MHTRTPQATSLFNLTCHNSHKFQTFQARYENSRRKINGLHISNKIPQRGQLNFHIVALIQTMETDLSTISSQSNRIQIQQSD